MVGIAVDSGSLYESSIKAMVLAELYKSGVIDVGSVVASEFSLGGLVRRIDLAAMSDCLIGIEIKSEFDSLKRLNVQLDAYSRVFDQVMVVSAEKHVSKILATVPDHVAIWRVCSKGSADLTRKGRRGPRHTSADLARILTVVELRRALKVPSSCVKSRSELLAMATRLPIKSVRNAVRHAFSRRFGATSSAFWAHVQHESLSSEHLHQLSRFRNRRKGLEEFKAQQEKFWKDWNACANDDLRQAV